MGSRRFLEREALREPRPGKKTGPEGQGRKRTGRENARPCEAPAPAGCAPRDVMTAGQQAVPRRD